MRSAETLQSLLDLIPAAPDQRCVEVACGPGLIARGLAPRVGLVCGVDLTFAMLDVATAEARAAGRTNAHFCRGDATRLPFGDASVDGAVTRFSLHHIPVPGRCVEEMARIVRQGGWVVIGDHVTSADQEAAAWHQEIERLRDPSHWACLSPALLRRTCQQAGLTLRQERLVPFTLDYEEWLTRGSGGVASRNVIDRSHADRPSGIDEYHRTVEDDGRALLHLRYWLSLWERP